MDVVSIRLECLRLAYRHDLGPSDVVARARELEAYVTAGQPEKPTSAGSPFDDDDGPADGKGKHRRARRP